MEIVSFPEEYVPAGDALLVALVRAGGLQRQARRVTGPCARSGPVQSRFAPDGGGSCGAAEMGPSLTPTVHERARST